MAKRSIGPETGEPALTHPEKMRVDAHSPLKAASILALLRWIDSSAVDLGWTGP